MITKQQVHLRLVYKMFNSFQWLQNWLNSHTQSEIKIYFHLFSVCWTIMFLHLPDTRQSEYCFPPTKLRSLISYWNLVNVLFRFIIDTVCSPNYWHFCHWRKLNTLKYINEIEQFIISSMERQGDEIMFKYPHTYSKNSVFCMRVYLPAFSTENWIAYTSSVLRYGRLLSQWIKWKSIILYII